MEEMGRGWWDEEIHQWGAAAGVKPGCDLDWESLPSPRPVLHEGHDGYDSTRREIGFVCLCCLVFIYLALCFSIRLHLLVSVTFLLYDLICLMDFGGVDSISSFHAPRGKPVISLCESSLPSPLFSLKHPFSPCVFIPAVVHFKGALSLQDTEMLIEGSQKNKVFLTLCAHNDCVFVCSCNFFPFVLLCLHTHDKYHSICCLRAHHLLKGCLYCYRSILYAKDVILDKFESVCSCFVILALTESVSVCVFLQQRNLEGYVGFANLPNQVYRKSVKRGFEFTLMVVGKLE